MYKPFKYIIISAFILISLIVSLFYILHNQPKYSDKKAHVNSCIVVYPDGYEQGKELFNTECLTCHKIKQYNYIKYSIITNGSEFVKLYITKEDSLVKAKNQTALEINKLWGNHWNHNYKFSKDELESLVVYLK